MTEGRRRRVGVVAEVSSEKRRASGLTRLGVGGYTLTTGGDINFNEEM